MQGDAFFKVLAFKYVIHNKNSPLFTGLAPACHDLVKLGKTAPAEKNIGNQLKISEH
jgi:hypothetical protein